MSRERLPRCCLSTHLRTRLDVRCAPVCGVLRTDCTKPHQVFFKAGFVEINSNFSVYFDDRTQRQLMETHLVKQNPETMHVTSAKLTWEIFGQVRGPCAAGCVCLSCRLAWPG